MAAQSEEEAEQDITRCACGIKEEKVGVLMIQCEDCFVWQHADCMNVTEETLPELYYCENCKPNGHPYYQLFVASSSLNQAPKGKRKRNTMNSRSAQDDEEFLKILSMTKEEAETADHQQNSTSSPQKHESNVQLDVSTIISPSDLHSPDSEAPESSLPSLSKPALSFDSALLTAPKPPVLTEKAPSKRKRQKKENSPAKEGRKKQVIKNDSPCLLPSPLDLDIHQIPVQDQENKDPSLLESIPLTDQCSSSTSTANTFSFPNNQQPTKYSQAKKKIKKFTDMHKRVQSMLAYLVDSKLVDPSTLQTPSKQDFSYPEDAISTLALCATSPLSEKTTLDASQVSLDHEWESSRDHVLLEGNVDKVSQLIYAALLRFQDHLNFV